MERKCLNTACQYHRKGKCTLFPGYQWLTCKRSGIKPANGKSKGKRNG